MPTQAVSERGRLGILALPVSSVLILVANLIAPFPREPVEDVRAWAEFLGSSRLALGDALASVGALLTIFAFVALYAYLANGRAERWAFYAMVLCVPGLVSVVAGSVQRAAFAPLANQYLEGQQAAWEQAWTISNDLSAGLTWADGFFVLGNLVLFPVGLVLFAVAIWRSQTLPQGAAILWLAYVLLLLAVSLTSWALLISDVLFTIASGWIAWVILRQPSAGVAEAESQPRVR